MTLKVTKGHRNCRYSIGHYNKLKMRLKMQRPIWESNPRPW